MRHRREDVTGEGESYIKKVIVMCTQKQICSDRLARWINKDRACSAHGRGTDAYETNYGGNEEIVRKTYAWMGGQHEDGF
jgi:hypothetical protein